MVRHTDMEVIVMKEEVCYTYQSQESEAQHTTQGHWGKHRGQSGGEGVKGKQDLQPLLCFCRKKWIDRVD